MNEQELIAFADSHFHSMYAGASVAEARESLDCPLNDPIAQLVADRIESAVAEFEPDKRAAFLATDLQNAARDIQKIATGFRKKAARPTRA